MFNIFVFTSKGSVLIKCEPENTVAWLLDTVTKRMQLRQLSSPFEEAYREDGTCLAKEEMLEGLAEDHPALLLLQKGQIDNLPPIAQSFFTEEALERLKGISNSGKETTKTTTSESVSSETTTNAHEELLNLRKQTLMKFSANGKGGVARRTARKSTMPTSDEDISDDKKRLNRLSTLWDKLMVEENQKQQTEIETTTLNPAPLDPSKKRVGFNSESELNVETTRPNRNSKLMLDQMDAWIGEIDRDSEKSARSQESASLSPRISRFDESSKRLSGPKSTGAGVPPPPPPAPPAPPMLANGPPPPPPPPPMLAGGPPRNESGLTLAPPPPPMLAGGPPPPPPPPGMMASSPAPAKVSAADLQSQMMNMLNDPNLRKKLRKVQPRESPNPSLAKPELTAEQQAAQDEADSEKAIEEKKRAMAEERENLVMEMLGFMETPNGSIEDLVDRCTKQTSIARGFIYTLVRRSWVKAFRLRKVYPEEEMLEKGKKRKHVPCTVFPGIQWTSAVELPDEDEEKLKQIYPERERVGQAHMYRFDQSLQKHLMDTIVFYKSSAFPPPFQKFTKPEPPQDASLENRNKWEIWNRKKQAHMQSDSAQYDLIWNKLVMTEATLEAAFSQLETTITQIREMNAAVTESFADIPLADLRKLVLSIPSQIKKVAQKLHETNGIIIRDTDLKLTPAFIKSLSQPDQKTDEQLEAEFQASKRVSRNNRTSFVNFGGLPIETVLPLLQSLKAREETEKDKKASRRFTLW